MIIIWGYRISTLKTYNQYFSVWFANGKMMNVKRSVNCPDGSTLKELCMAVNTDDRIRKVTLSIGHMPSCKLFNATLYIFSILNPSFQILNYE